MRQFIFFSPIVFILVFCNIKRERETRVLTTTCLTVITTQLRTIKNCMARHLLVCLWLMVKIVIFCSLQINYRKKIMELLNQSSWNHTTPLISYMSPGHSVKICLFSSSIHPSIHSLSSAYPSSRGRGNGPGGKPKHPFPRLDGSCKGRRPEGIVIRCPVRAGGVGQGESGRRSQSKGVS